MAHDSLVFVESFSTSIEAELFKNWLRNEGIEAFVDGTGVANALAHVGSALSGARVLVVESELAEAQQLLSQYREVQGNKTSWYCSDCREYNEPSFDMCWKCQGARSEKEGQPPAPSKEVVSMESILNPNTAINSKPDFENPYESSVARKTAKNEEDTEAPLSAEQAENMIERAWRAAWLGPSVPVLLTLYSITLLLGSLDVAEPISPKARRHRLQAWIVNVLYLMAATILVWLMFAPASLYR